MWEDSRILVMSLIIFVKALSKPEFPHLNKSKFDPYQQYYNGHTKDLVEKYFQLDLKLFNYSF